MDGISVHRLTPSPAVISAALDGEAVLLNTETGLYIGLDPVGTRIWELLGEGITGPELFDRLLDEYDVERERLQADLAAFLSELAELGLVSVVGA